MNETGKVQYREIAAKYGKLEEYNAFETQNTTIETEMRNPLTSDERYDVLHAQLKVLSKQRLQLAKFLLECVDNDKKQEQE